MWNASLQALTVKVFLVEKMNGSWRSVINLSPQKKFVLQAWFKIGRAQTVLKSIREGDLMLNRSEGCLLSSVHSSELSKVPTLCLLQNHLIYQFKVWNLVFTLVLVWAYSKGICLLWYLDQLLFVASLEVWLLQDKRLSSHLLLQVWDWNQFGRTWSHSQPAGKVPVHGYRFGCRKTLCSRGWVSKLWEVVEQFLS